MCTAPTRDFIHSAVCRTTGPQRLPKRFLYRVRSSASSFNLEHPFFFLLSSSSCLRLLPFLRHISFLQKSVLEGSSYTTCDQTSQPSFLPFIVCRTFLSSLTPNTSFLTRSAQLCFPSISSTTFQNVQAISDLISEVSRFQYCAIQFSKCNISIVSSLKLRPICW